MKQVININFQGRVIPIETLAYDSLKQYLDSLRNFFSLEEGRDEILNDIEARISELFQERLKNGAACITEDDVAAIKRNMGTPEDISGETGASADEKHTGAQQSNTSFFGNGQNRLYRNENDKVLGGVCSGLGNYMGIDPTIIRVLFVLLVLMSVGIVALGYILLWAIVPSSSVLEPGSARKRLYRDTDNKILGGVCSGLGKYFNTSEWIFRILFLIPLITITFRWFDHWDNLNFSGGINGGSILLYILMWILIPEAKSTSEKLEMRGEKVDMNSIKNSVVNEMKGASDRITVMGNEAGRTIRNGVETVGGDIQQAFRRNNTSLGDIIATAAKVFLYIIAGAALITVLSLLIAAFVGSATVFPIKNYVLTGTLQNVYAWGTLLLFIGVPIVAIITYIIRRLTKSHGGSSILRTSTIVLWILGWISATMLATTLSKEFRRDSNPITDSIQISQTASSLVLSSSNPYNPYTRNKNFRNEMRNWLNEDTAYVPNISFNIFRSEDTAYHVTVIKGAKGRDRSQANSLAAKIEYDIRQQDSVLYLPKGIQVNKTDKFRNQHVIVNVYVPVGKRIKIDNALNTWNGVYIDGFTVDNSHSWDDEGAEDGWDFGKTYTMTKDGLIDSKGKVFNRDKWRWDDKESTNINDDTDSDTKADSIELEKRHIKDSLEIEKQKLERKIEDLQTSTKVTLNYPTAFITPATMSLLK